MIFYIPVDMKNAMTNPFSFYFWKLVIVLFFSFPAYMLAGLCIRVDSIRLYPLVDIAGEYKERVEVIAGEHKGKRGKYIDVSPHRFGMPTVWYIELDTGERIQLADNEWRKIAN